MFSIIDLLGMSDYFAFLSANKNTSIEVMSKNTNHCWKIVEEKDCFSLYHRHGRKGNYHYHSAWSSLYDTVLDIVNHDEYQLRGRRGAKHKRELKNSYFAKMIEKYGN